MKAERTNDRSTLLQITQSWEYQGGGFPQLIEEELLEYVLTDEHVRVACSLKDTYVRIEGWMLDLLRVRRWITPEKFDEIVRSGYRGQIQKEERAYVSDDWTLQYTTVRRIDGHDMVSGFRIIFTLPGTHEMMSLSSEFRELSQMRIECPNWIMTLSPVGLSNESLRSHIEKAASSPSF